MCNCDNCTCTEGKCLNCACDCTKCVGQGGKMQCCWKGGRSAKILLAALLLASGPMVAGYFISHAIKSGPVADRSIEVPITSERDVKADYGDFRIRFQATSNEIVPLHEKYIKDRDLIVGFLKSKGFTDEDIDVGAPAIVDLKSLEWGKEKLEAERYVMKARVKVTTKNIDAIKAAAKATDDLLKQGVILADKERFSEEVNPRYYLKEKELLERELYSQAVEKGKELAKQMAENLGVKITGIRSVTQERPMEIFSSDSVQTDYQNTSSLKGSTKKAKLHLRMKFNVE